VVLDHLGDHLGKHGAPGACGLGVHTLADALVARSRGRHQSWGDAVIFEACTAARIGEVSGCRLRDNNIEAWIRTIRRQTTPSPGGLVDKNSQGKRAPEVPLIAAIRDLVNRRIDLAGNGPTVRLTLLYRLEQAPTDHGLVTNCPGPAVAV
jgi:integrase